MQIKLFNADACAVNVGTALILVSKEKGTDFSGLTIVICDITSFIMVSRKTLF